VANTLAYFVEASIMLTKVMLFKVILAIVKALKLFLRSFVNNEPDKIWYDNF